VRRTVWLLAWTALLAAPLPSEAAEPATGRVAEPKAASPDADLLEFLGNSDDADADLQDYLARPVRPPPRSVDAGEKPRSSGT
jgi:hypothetical protein